MAQRRNGSPANRGRGFDGNNEDPPPLPDCFLYGCSYHHSGGDGNTSTAIRVGHDVAETDAQERDGDEPHGVEEIRVLLVVESIVTQSDNGLFQRTTT